MAECSLSRPLNFCDYSAGGINTIFFGNLKDVISFDIERSTDMITGVTMQLNRPIFLFDLVGNWVNANEEKTDSDNGYFVTQTVEFDLARMENEKRQRIHEMCHEDTFAITIDKNGRKFVYGQEYGLNLNKSSSRSGRNVGDFNGYSVTLIGSENGYAREVNMSTAALLSLTVNPPVFPVLSCAVYSAVTWGSPALSNAYFGVSKNCNYFFYL